MNKTSLQERLRGAIWGQFVGDAAALGTHFYDLKELERRFPQGIHGFEVPDAKHAHAKKKSGDFTHYGDAALIMLQSLVFQHGFSARNFGTLFVETFASPDYPNYINKATRETIENYHLSLEEGHPDLGYDFQDGANDENVDTATRLASLIAVYWDDPKLLSIVDRATRVTQNNEITIAYIRCYARILRSLIQGEDLKLAFQNEIQTTPNDTPIDHHVREKISLALSLESLDVKKATLQLGQNSHLDHCFPSAIHAALTHHNSFTNAILDTIQAGGDTAGRDALVGSWLGAHLGIKSIPETWLRRLNHYNEIEKGIESLLSIKAISR